MSQKFAVNWHEALYRQDMARVWSMMTPNFRRVVAQVVLVRGPRSAAELNGIVEELAVSVPARQDLPQFYTAACSILKNACGVLPDEVGAGTSTRIEAPVFEIVRLYMLEDLPSDDDGNHFLPPDNSARALTLIASADEQDSWRMAGIGMVLTPGWPPQLAWEPPAEV